MKHKERNNMSLLQDKHFEDLDFISQAVEPFYHPALDIFKTLPNEIHITTEELKGIVSDRYGETKTLDDYRLEQKIKETIESLPNVAEFHSICSKFYDVKINNINYDVYDDVLTGSVTLVKKADCPLTQEMIAGEIRNLLSNSMRSYDRAMFSKKDLLDLSHLFLGTEVTSKIMSDKLNLKQTWYTVTNEIQKVLMSKDSKYRIRGHDAADKLSRNIADFVERRNSDRAMANLTLFKMVMDKGNAIYSLQEIEQ